MNQINVGQKYPCLCDLRARADDVGGGAGGERPRAVALLVTAPEISHVAANSPAGMECTRRFFPTLVRLFTTVGGYRSARI